MMPTTWKLQTLANLSLLNRETTAKMQEVLKSFQKCLSEAQEMVERISMEDVFALLLPEDQRPEITRFTVNLEGPYSYHKSYSIGLVRDARIPTFAVPVMLKGSYDVQPSKLYIEIFSHRYVSPVTQNNCTPDSDSVRRSWPVATVPYWVEQTNDLPAYLEYYRCLLEVVRHAGVKQLYLPPQGYAEGWKYRMARFAFEQVRAELGVDCVLVEKYDPAFCEFRENTLVTRSDAPILLKYLP